MKTVPLRGKKAAGRVARVDDGDYELVSAYTWYVYEAKRPGRRTQGPYATAPIWRDGKWTTIRMHTLIMGRKGIDHKDHDGLNNQRSNLRDATPGQNSHNTRAHAGAFSRFKGVSCSFDGNIWVAQICVNGHNRRLGRFPFEEEAARAYDAAAREAFGEYAYLNFPDQAA
jgi:hypothetical protein